MNGASKQGRKAVRRTRLRKSFTGLHLLLNLALMVALWGMVNYLSFRNGFREDWSRQQLTELSPKTLSVLEGLEAPVKVLSLMSKEFRAADEVEDLLREYERLGGPIEVEFIDPDRDLGATKDLRSRYDLTRPDRLVLVSRDRHIVLDLERMPVMEPDETRQLGRPPRMVGFRGEALLTSGLLELTRTERPVVYFLSGHGEKDIDNFENGPEAYSDVRERLERDNIDVRTLNLEQTRRVPEDADALVVAGPRTRIAQPEIDLLRHYMNERGRMMVMVDVMSDAGLSPLLKEQGVQLLPDMVVDPSRTLQGSDVHVTTYGEHPVTASMEGLRSIFIRPRSVLPADPEGTAAADRPRYTALAASTARGWAELNLKEQPVRFDPGVDQRGPIPIAAAVEWTGNGDGGEAAPGKRLVVVGDSVFAGNWLKNGGGMLLMRNAVNWLLQRDELIRIPPKEVTEIRLRMDQRGLNRLLLEVAVLLPAAAAALGILVSWRRRS